jgi:hypothetical protein
MSLNTNKKTLTKEGTTRKRALIVMKLLEQYEIYDDLVAQANAIIKEDNENPTSGIVDIGLGVVHHPSWHLIQSQREHLKELRNYKDRK